MGSGPLGIGTWTAALTQRGGGQVIAILPHSRIEWNRIRNDVSAASVTVPLSSSPDDLLSDALNDVTVYHHELALFRSTDPSEPMWVGPIVNPSASMNAASAVAARDLFHWTDRRRLHIDRDLTADLAFLFQTFFDDCFTRDETPNVHLIAKDTGVVVSRKIVGKDLRAGGDALRDLTRSGIDFTTVKRDVLAGKLSAIFDEPLPIWGPAVSDARWEQRGIEHKTEQSVIAGLPPIVGLDPSANERVVATVPGGGSTYYGLLEGASVELDVGDAESAVATARALLPSSPPEYLTVDFAPDAPFGMDDLVPGRLADVRLRINWRTVQGTFVLNSVSGTDDVSNTGGDTEKISAAFVPLLGVDS